MSRNTPNAPFYRRGARTLHIDWFVDGKRRRERRWYSFEITADCEDSANE
jgi:hypothetical protein